MKKRLVLILALLTSGSAAWLSATTTVTAVNSEPEASDLESDYEEGRILSSVAYNLDEEQALLEPTTARLLHVVRPDLADEQGGSQSFKVLYKHSFADDGDKGWSRAPEDSLTANRSEAIPVSPETGYFIELLGAGQADLQVEQFDANMIPLVTIEDYPAIFEEDRDRLQAFEVLTGTYTRYIKVNFLSPQEKPHKVKRIRVTTEQEG